VGKKSNKEPEEDPKPRALNWSDAKRRKVFEVEKRRKCSTWIPGTRKDKT